MALTERNKQLIIVVITIVVAVAGFYFGNMQYQSAMEAKKDLNNAQADLENKQSELSDLKTLNEKLTNMRVEIDDVKKVVPQGPDIPELLVNLEAIASRSLMTFNSVTVSEAGRSTSAAEGTAVSPTGVQNLSISVSVTGEYNNLKVYLDSLEKNIRLLDVQSVSMGSEGSYNLTMNAYYVN